MCVEFEYSERVGHNMTILGGSVLREIYRPEEGESNSRKESNGGLNSFAVMHEIL
jgi:hypothetical protein